MIKTTVKLEISEEDAANFNAEDIMEKMFKALEALGYKIDLEKNEKALPQVQKSDEKQS